MSQPESMTVTDFVTLLKGHLNVVAIGLSGANPQVPPQILIPSIAAAMAQVLSEATVSPDISLTLSMRKNAVEAFTDEIRKHRPAMQSVKTLSLKAS